MGTNPVQRGETSRTVSAAVGQLRTQQNLSLRGLSKKLHDIGRPLTHSAIDRIEKGERRIDVDDLIAFAKVLNVSPATLLGVKAPMVVDAALFEDFLRIVEKATSSAPCP